MPIVSGGRRLPVLGASAAPSSKKWKNRQYQTMPRRNNREMLKFYGRTIQQVEENLATVMEHFGCRKGEAWRIGLHLLAKAIRENKARPDPRL